MEELIKKLKELKFSEQLIDELNNFDKDYQVAYKLENIENVIDQTSHDLTELTIKENIEPQTRNFIISQV